MGGRVLELETDKWYAGFKEGQLDKDNAVRNGRKEERTQLTGVIRFLMGQKRYDDLTKASEDEDYYQTILSEMRDAGLIDSDEESDI